MACARCPSPGISERIKGRIVPLLQKLQPGAVTYGAGIENDANEVDWIGTETGEPVYPVWSPGCNAPGAGGRGVSPASPSATAFCPKGADCTLQSPDTWFWEPDHAIKPLSQLIDMYHHTVGSNAVMELDFAVDRTGNIDPRHAARYVEFGAWIKGCYGTPVAGSGWVLGSSAVLHVPGGGTMNIDRVAIMEDISRGQRITKYTVEVQLRTGSDWQPFSAGTAVGHKRIDVVAAGAQVSAVRITISDGVELPANISLAAFAPCSTGVVR